MNNKPSPPKDKHLRIYICGRHNTDIISGQKKERTVKCREENNQQNNPRKVP